MKAQRRKKEGKEGRKKGRKDNAGRRENDGRMLKAGGREERKEGR